MDAIASKNLRNTKNRVDVRHPHVALGVRVGMAGVVDELAGRLVLRDARDLDAAGLRAAAAIGADRPGELGAEAARLHLGEHDLLAAIRLAVGAARGLRVGEVLRRDVHPQPLGGEAGGGDVERVEHAHVRHPCPWRP